MVRRFVAIARQMFGMPPQPPPSPCIRICQLDAETGWCSGCGRTGQEIGDWLFLSTSQRLTLMAELPKRLALLAKDRRVGEAGAQPVRDS
jgi:predicted Fe-S protein YdhL (DUF1289 family)